MTEVNEGKNIKTQQELEEDAAAGGGVTAGGAAATAAMGDAGFATLGNTPGMGQPQLASRGVTGSGDVASPMFKKKKKKKVLGYKEILSDIFNKK
jgi:hypothetical protein